MSKPVRCCPSARKHQPHWRVVASDAADTQFVSVRDGRIELSEHSEDAVLIVRRRILRDRAPLADRDMQVLKFPYEQQPPSKFRAIVFAPGGPPCRAASEPWVWPLHPLPAATDRVRASIKEGDYDARALILPSDSETAFIEVNGLGHGVGE